MSEKYIKDSPFHRGEQQIQSRVGKRDEMEQFGKRVIRHEMPDQHRDFYKQLPFLVFGSVDNEGWPWASIISGKPGFAHSADPKLLRVDANAIGGDPLKSAIETGSPVGMLGIELNTRRRNRLNAHVSKLDKDGFTLSVDQAFGNCPQYIQTRSVEFQRDSAEGRPDTPLDTFTDLDSSAREIISNADTFFVASYIKAEERPDVEGVDVSHRGGQPGFVKADGNTLTIPDYAGNNHFNTLGNFLLNPKAGLIFLDFKTGDVMMLTGIVELIWEDDPEVKAFNGAMRAWKFTLDHGVRLKQALPFRTRFQEFSPNSLLTGNWVQAAGTRAAESTKNRWCPYRLIKIQDESEVIRSFYIEPAEDSYAIPAFKAGQFISLRLTLENSKKPLVRTYTVSSAPGSDYLRISVKREQHGAVSGALHDSLKPGDVIEAKAPGGDFYINEKESRPAVLIAGGVGITPMISMAQHIANEGVRSRYTRSLTILHSAKNTRQRAFYTDFKHLEQQTGGYIRYFSFVTQVLEDEKAGVDFNGNGRISVDVLRQVLHLDDYDFYLCGPSDFMQALYDGLIGLGVHDKRIHAEAFGPASLQRKVSDSHSDVVIETAETALIRFTRSGFEQMWSKQDGNLLEFAESHGLEPEFGCRRGDCGSCAVTSTRGNIVHKKTTAAVEPREILLCCAYPAKGSDVVELDL